MTEKTITRAEFDAAVDAYWAEQKCKSHPQTLAACIVWTEVLNRRLFGPRPLRVKIANPVMGVCHMQVCADRQATDQEILDVCNRENPSGTTAGWTTVLRFPQERNEQNPVDCAEDPGRQHILVRC